MPLTEQSTGRAMPAPALVAYVGDERRGVDLLELFESRLHRSVHAAAAGPNGAERVLDAPVDAVVCGPELSPAELQTVVFETADRRPGTPVFNLTGEPVAAPERLDIRQFDADTPAETAVERLAGTVVDGDAEPRTLGQYLAVDDAWRVVDWDPRLAAWTGVDPAEAIGESLWTVLPAGRDGELAATHREAATAGEPTTTEVFHAPTERWFSLRVVPLRAGGLESYLHEITEYREQAFGADGRLEQTLDRITDAFFALDTDERFVFLNSRAEFVLDVEEESVLGRQFPEVFPAATGTDFYEAFREALSSRDPTSFREYYRPLERWFEVNAYPSEDGLSVFLRDVTEQVGLRHRLEQLHEVTQELVVAESDDAIAAETVRAAADVLGYDRVIVWRHDQQTQRLVPIAVGAGIEADPTTNEDAAPGPVAPGTEPIWGVYEDGESQLTGYVSAAATAEYRPDAVASELLVPIGEYGVLAVYDEQRDAFDEPDAELFRVLAGAAASAFVRARRERQLARRNERLDEFASVVSHDLRNPISVAAAHVELARDADDPTQHLDTIDEALFRMEELIDDLLARARGDRELAREELSLAEAARDAWESVDTAAASLTVDDARLNADPDRLRQLFENLFRNAVEHVGEDVAVRVGPRESGFYVADDGPGIPPDQREEVFEQGVTYSESGTGFGLAIVADIVEGHGWTIEVADAATGGARFEVTGVRSLAPAR
ncbi:hypothetical protein BRC62_06825 [Halobacteriales archaeon QH_10_67_13]|nr:MAG: hypothetical protein BRC62_06825 [Halobacteriales archaeon QH_10_67_13]